MSSHSQTKPLAISGLIKRYGDFEVLKNLELSVNAGSVHGLVGLNGSGKTSTIECLLGLQPFQGGSITVQGLAPAHLHKARGKVVAIFDTPSLHPHLTVRQCLQHARMLCDEVRREPAAVEKLLGIEKFTDFKVRNLSLGNKRRASIAQALIGNPEFIVLDEPFNGLDAEGVDDVLALIGDLNKESGVTFLLSSHQLPYLEQVCSHIAILHQGRIALSDDVDTLLKQSSAKLQINTPLPEQAIAVIEATDGVSYLQTDSTGAIHAELTALDSATLNSILVDKQVPVAQLRLETASLAGLFRQITGGTP